MKTFGSDDLQEQYKQHHIEDDCRGNWTLIQGLDMPYKVDDGIAVILQNPPIVHCSACGVQFFAEGFEKRMLKMLVSRMIFDHRPMTSNHIRFIRSFAGMTQVEVAQELGVRKEAISRYESKKDPHPMQPGEQVRFKLLIISRMGLEIPKGAQLWKTEKASLVGLSESYIRKIDAREIRSEAS